MLELRVCGAKFRVKVFRLPGVANVRLLLYSSVVFGTRDW